jgi:hypothetical protein
MSDVHLAWTDVGVAVSGMFMGRDTQAGLASVRTSAGLVNFSQPAESSVLARRRAENRSSTSHGARLPPASRSLSARYLSWARPMLPKKPKRDEPMTAAAGSRRQLVRRDKATRMYANRRRLAAAATTKADHRTRRRNHGSDRLATSW